MQGEHWIMIANSRQILCFAVSLGRKMCSSVKQQYEEMIPEPLQSHPSVCGFYTIYEAFHFFKFWREEKQEFTMLMCFHSEVITCIFSISLM